MTDHSSSIFSDRTTAPLDITSSLLGHLCDQYATPPEFDDVIASFGQEPNLAEGNSNYAAIRVDEIQGSEITFQIRYIEQNNRGGPNKWSLRHTGVFHRHSASEADLVIVLHPIEDPKLQDVISALQEDHAAREEFCRNPLKLHEAFFACYTDDWRWYLRDLGERFNGENNRGMMMRPERTEPNATFACVRSLRNTKDLIHFARACCAGNLDLIDRLESSFMGLTESAVKLGTHRTKLSGYVKSADVLMERIQNLIDLVSTTASSRIEDGIVN